MTWNRNYIFLLVVLWGIVKVDQSKGDLECQVVDDGEKPKQGAILTYVVRVRIIEKVRFECRFEGDKNLSVHLEEECSRQREQ